MKISHPSSRQEASVAWATRSRTLVNRFEVRFEDAQKFRVQQGRLSAFLPALWERPISTIFRGNPRNFFFENT